MGIPQFLLQIWPHKYRLLHCADIMAGQIVAQCLGYEAAVIDWQQAPCAMQNFSVELHVLVVVQDLSLERGLSPRHDDCPSGVRVSALECPWIIWMVWFFCLFVLTATDQSAYRTRPAMSSPKAKCMTGQGTAPKFIPVFALSLWRTALLFISSTHALFPLAFPSRCVLFLLRLLAAPSCCAAPWLWSFFVYSSSHAVFSEQGALQSWQKNQGKRSAGEKSAAVY